jgi:hypothetical protein
MLIISFREKAYSRFTPDFSTDIFYAVIVIPKKNQLMHLLSNLKLNQF